jgi:hypothetical protein
MQYSSSLRIEQECVSSTEPAKPVKIRKTIDLGMQRKSMYKPDLADILIQSSMTTTFKSLLQIIKMHHETFSPHFSINIRICKLQIKPTGAPSFWNLKSNASN